MIYYNRRVGARVRSPTSKPIFRVQPMSTDEPGGILVETHLRDGVLYGRYAYWPDCDEGAKGRRVALRAM